MAVPPDPLTPPQIARLQHGQHPAAAAVLAEAFRHDPLWKLLLPAESRRAGLMPGFFQAYLGLGRGQNVFAVPGAGPAGADPAAPLLGAAIWQFPQVSPEPARPLPFRLIASLLPNLVSGFLPALLRVLPVFRLAERLHKRHAPGAHYYLEVLGVHSLARGRGLASALLRPVLAEADARRLPAYLETMTPANLPLYAHFGFRVAEHRRFDRLNLDVWSLLRPAR